MELTSHGFVNCKICVCICLLQIMFKMSLSLHSIDFLYTVLFRKNNVVSPGLNCICVCFIPLYQN